MSGVSPETVFARSVRLLFRAGVLLILASGAPIAGKAQPVESSEGTPNA
jgi:hypothetical protein